MAMRSLANSLIEPVSSEAAPLTREERKLLNACIALIVIIAFPGKLLFYTSPGVLVLISLIFGGFVRFWRLVGIVLGITALSLSTIAFDLVDGGHANVPGLIFGVINYLPIFILWSLSQEFRVSETFAWRLANVCVGFVVFECAIGALQWVIAHDSDLVNGTFGLFDIATNEKTISQVNFCFTMFCIAVYCALWIENRRMKLACSIALGTALVAETAHQTLFFGILIPALAVTGGRRFRRLSTAVGVIATLFMAAFFFDPKIVEYIDSWANKVLSMPTSPKRLAVTSAVEMMDGKNLLLGVGLGQFSSRAAILSSGSGSSLNLPKMLVDRSTYYEHFMTQAVSVYGQNGEHSAMAMPYFSILSVTTEFGLVIAVIILFKVIQTIIENVRLGAASQMAWRASCYCNFFIGFLFLCSFIQNYLELTQAIMIPVLLYIVSKARLRGIAESVNAPRGL